MDFDFLETYGLELVAGRDFSEAFPTDVNQAFLVNEAAVEALGWEQPLGQRMRWRTWDGQVIGVVKNFNYASLHDPVEPLVLHIGPWISYMAVKLNTPEPGGALADLRHAWTTLLPDTPFDYYFLNDGFERLYQAEQRLQQTVEAFTLLALFVASLGLFGLVAFLAQQRRKEIGIRKVMGASVSSLVVLLSKDFVRLVGLAYVVAAPLAYLAVHRWLDSFAYRIEISWTIFLMAGLAALGVALLAVSYQSVRAALADPVESLRYE